MQMTFELPSSEIIDRSPIEINTRKCLILSDLHIPYHNNTAISAALSHGLRAGVDTILLNGDVIDFYQLSRFTKDPRKECVAEELARVKMLFTTIRKHFKRAQIYYIAGNHEERLEHYAMNSATALVGVAGLDLEHMMDLDKFRIRLIRDKRRAMIGRLNVLHGHEYQGIGFAISPARGIFMKAKAPTIVGHCHRKSDYSEKTLDGKSIGCWSTGCLCDMSPDYSPYNNWCHGFAIVELDDSGHYTVHNHYISKDGIVY